MKLVVCYIIENDEDVFELSYNSIKDIADEVVVIDGNHYEILNGMTLEEYNYIIPTEGKIIHSPYPHKDKGANGIQRNKYIDYLKEHHEGDWCLVLDADEVVENPERIKNICQEAEHNNIDCMDIWMRHFVGNLGHEDSTVKTHYVPTRLFKITKDISYDEGEHVTLRGAKGYAKTAAFKIWHLGYSRDVFNLRKKYLNHKEKSQIHTPQFLEYWYHSHLMGTFPTSNVKTEDLPDIITDYFEINRDYLYFKDRGFELKHAECVKQWNQYFQPESVLDVGCGRGPYLRYWEDSTNLAIGIEISKWAIKNKLCESHIRERDIISEIEKDANLGFDIYSRLDDNFDLVTAIDILEHLEEKDLPKALNNIYSYGNKDFLFSIPFEGDPNLYGDPTHKIFKPKKWWIEQLEKTGFKIKQTPKHFYFKEQMVVATK